MFNVATKWNKAGNSEKCSNYPLLNFYISMKINKIMFRLHLLFK
jgi:hypothetical protein